MSTKNKSQTITEKTDQLRELVAWFDGDDFLLEEAMQRFESAQKLAEEIEADLKNLKNEITIVSQKFDEDV